MQPQFPDPTIKNAIKIYIFFLQEEVIPCCPHVCSPESIHLFTLGLSHIRFRHWDCYWKLCKYIQTTVWSTQLKNVCRILLYYMIYNYQVCCAFPASILPLPNSVSLSVEPAWQLTNYHCSLLSSGWLCICGSSVALPVSSCLLLDAVWGCHAVPHVGGCFQQALQEVVVLPYPGMGWVVSNM